MSPNQYQMLSQRTVMSNAEQAQKIIESLEDSPRKSQLIVAALKLNSESGELADTIVKHICYGQKLDEENIVEECGDLLWYIALILTKCNTTMEVCMHNNIGKLKLRYPEKFTEQDAFERKDKKDDKVLYGIKRQFPL